MANLPLQHFLIKICDTVGATMNLIGLKGTKFQLIDQKFDLLHKFQLFYNIISENNL